MKMLKCVLSILAMGFDFREYTHGYACRELRQGEFAAKSALVRVHVGRGPTGLKQP